MTGATKTETTGSAGFGKKLELITDKLNQQAGKLGLSKVDDSLVLLVAAAVITTMSLIVIWMLIRG